MRGGAGRSAAAETWPAHDVGSVAAAGGAAAPRLARWLCQPCPPAWPALPPARAHLSARVGAPGPVHAHQGRQLQLRLQLAHHLLQGWWVGGGREREREGLICDLGLGRRPGQHSRASSRGQQSRRIAPDCQLPCARSLVPHHTQPTHSAAGPIRSAPPARGSWSPPAPGRRTGSPCTTPGRAAGCLPGAVEVEAGRGWTGGEARRAVGQQGPAAHPPPHSTLHPALRPSAPAPSPAAGSPPPMGRRWNSGSACSAASLASGTLGMITFSSTVKRTVPSP